MKEELVEIVGSENVLDDPNILDQYSRDYSLVSPRKPRYVVRVENTKELAEIVKLANKYLTPITPVSSGIHFNGTTIPAPGGMVIDLQRMNNILRIDKRNRVALIEPGVTWSQLQMELGKHDLHALNPLLPHASKSVVTTYLERDPILVTRFESSDPIFTMEVILPTGDILRTGSAVARGVPSNPKVALLGRWGPGFVNWHQLFQGAQGTFGIVTWMSIKLELTPKVEKLLFIPLKKVEDAIMLTYDVLRRLIPYEYLILNKFNLATIIAKEWPSDFEKLKQELPEWVVLCCIGGRYRRPEEMMEYKEEALREICLKFKLEFDMDFLPKFLCARDLRNAWPKETVYWKLRHKGGVQDVDFIAEPDKVPELTNAVYEIAQKHRYPVDEIGCYIQPLEYGYADHCFYSFYYDPNNAKNVEAINRLYQEMCKRLLKMGAFFSRPYGSLADIVYSQAGDYVTALRRVKAILDPNQIMNPGRLCFGGVA